MDRKIKIYIGFLVVLFIALVVNDYNKPKPIDWSPTYSLKDKIPYGMYVFDNEINSLLKHQKIDKINVTPYEYFDARYDYDTLVNDYKVNGTFLSISKNLITDEESTTEICSFVRYGNSAFISSETIPYALLDSLDLKIEREYIHSDSIYNWVANKKLGDKKYKITEGVNNNYFSKIDTLNTTVLGYQNGDSTKVNFIKIGYGEGTFYLHTQPVAFTNFHLLKSNHHEYAQKVLSYIPKGDVFWYTKDQDGSIISDSPFRYILSQPALKWAWYIFLMGMLVFILFNAKRKQRIVPIIKPLSNTTVDFTKTIGNLYFQEGDHNTIMDKKIIYFLEKIRNEYLIDTHKLDDDFIKKVQLKSRKDLDDIKNAISLINSYRKNNYPSIEEDLILLNKAIEKVIN
ncbi:DUF4350 domain-containing protein [Flavobacterium eburneipallidum]|uniref:DUF4350 domain-containing protein n=1 Tax=Flavobacterium eburneipallidum TaxID=3003263 RepID=UPI0024829407|nr:DUF4350 domain-containing protein [Flavobacterium eburneipallidum]